ncbi:MAG TPA: calcium-binding protein, partial [Methylomirabilota bacterium]|nr:calcium-binding protein [Methylomirabilota bacterium]
DLILTGDAPISGAGNDLDNAIAGNDAANTLLGHAGDDTLVGKGGPDRLDGGPGADMMTGNAGDDTYVVDNAGDVVVEIPGGGVDTVESALTYVLPADVENLKLIGSASIGGTGNGHANVIIGNSGNNFIDGGSGNDTLVGGVGNDTILGGAGNDTIEGGLGADTLDGGPGVDTLSFAGRSSGVKADLKSKTIDGDAVKGFENLTGSAFNDELSGTNGANVIFGGGGADRIEGRKGRDRLTGGAGKDVFVFRKVADSPARAPDTITDFRTGDRIDLSALDANIRLKGRQRFTWRGGRKFTRKPGELRFGKRALWADTDGDGRADFKVLLPGVKSLAKKAVKLR